MSLLKLTNIDVSLGNKTFFKGINLNIEKGVAYHLVGDNGSGKSTLLNEVAKQAKSISYAYLPQVAHQYPKVHFLLKDISEQEYSFYPRSLFTKSWHESSGGERKKALISKTLFEAKDLIILDEPFNHLDKISCEQIVLCLEELLDQGVSIVYTAHENRVKSSIEIEVKQWRL